MDAAELKRVKAIVEKAEEISGNIGRLKTSLSDCNETGSLLINFSPSFSVQCSFSHQWKVVAGSQCLAVLAPDFRKAITAVIEKQIAEYEKQLQDMSVREVT